MVGVNVVVASTDVEALCLFTTLQQLFLNLIRGHPREMPPPVETMEGRWNAMEEAQVHRMTRISAVGGPATVRDQLRVLLQQTEADELIATAPIFDHPDRLRSYELLATEGRP